MDTFNLKKYLAEGRLYENEDQKMVDAMAKKLNQSLKDMASDIKSVENEPESKKELNEAVGITVGALVIGAPGILKVLGKIAQGIGWLFGLNKDKEDDKKGNMVSRALEKAGNKLHHFYVKSIAKGFSSAYPEIYDVNRDDKIDDKEFKNAEVDAEKAYAGMLVAAAVATGWSAVAGLKAAEIGVDVADIIAIAKDLPKA